MSTQNSRRVPAWAGQRAATVEQRALQVEAELRRLLEASTVVRRADARFLYELRQALFATWDDGEAVGERTHGRGEPPQG